MNKKLRSLLVLVGTVIVGGTSYELFKVDKPDTKVDDLLDGGIGRGCTLMALSCTSMLSDEAIADLKSNKVSGKYGEIAFPVYRCDGALVYPPAFPMNKTLGKALFEDAKCELTPCPDPDGVCNQFDKAKPIVVKDHKCAWRPLGGTNCTRIDGGNPGDQNTMGPGQFTGTGCVRKACVEIAGETSTPEVLDAGPRH